jgi:GNAT superfamily N-acetyltransferase
VGLVVRPGSPDDADTLLVIQREASMRAFKHVYPPDKYPYPNEAVLELWHETLANPDVEVHVAEVDGEPVGVVSIGKEFLRQLYVLPAQQGTGVGSALHDLALERLRARGIQVARLWTLDENWPARRFYEKRGWELTDETRVVPYPPNPIDVQYAKELTEAQEIAEER